MTDSADNGDAVPARATHEPSRARLGLGRGAIGKTPVLAARERGGRTRARVVPNASAREIHRFMHRNIEYGSTVHTDEHGGYRRVGGARP